MPPMESFLYAQAHNQEVNMANGNITVGTMAIAKVGRNAIEAEVIALADGGAYLVRNRNGREFVARRLEPIEEICHVRGKLSEPHGFRSVENTSAESAQQMLIHLAGAGQDADETLNPAPESGRQEAPAKRRSLMNAAMEVLRRSEHPLSTREIVAQAVAAGLWSPTGAKTPEQTLYGAIFREIATKEQPRIVKAEPKGKFRLA